MNTDLGNWILVEFKDEEQLWKTIKNNRALQWLRSYKMTPAGGDPVVQYEQLHQFIKDVRRKLIAFWIFFSILFFGAIIATTLKFRGVSWGDLFSDKPTSSITIVCGILLMVLYASLIASAHEFFMGLLDSHLLRLWTAREFFADVKELAKTCGDTHGNPTIVLEARDELGSEIAPKHVLEHARSYLITEAGAILLAERRGDYNENQELRDGRKRLLKESLGRYKRLRLFSWKTEIEFAYEEARKQRPVLAT